MKQINWAYEVKKSALKIIRNGIKELNNREIRRDILIHNSRKRVKNLRAILKLIQDDLGEKTFKVFNTSLRNLNRKSANIRRSYVMLNIIDHETKTLSDAVSIQLFKNLKSFIEQKMIESQPKINVNRILNEYSDYFNSFEKNIESLKSNKKNFSLIKDGLSTIYDQGRGCYKMIITQDDAEIFHELRKNAKDLSNVLDIIQKAWPDVIKVYNNQLKVLTDHIGDIHDLYEFKLEINKFIKGNIPSEGTISLLKKLDSRINSLMLLSRKLGEKIYAEKTTSFIYRMNRISQYSI